MVERFANLIRDRRIELGYRLVDVADKMNTSITYIHDMENGRTVPTNPNVIRAIANAYRLDENLLLKLAKIERVLNCVRANYSNRSSGLEKQIYDILYKEAL